MTLNTLQAAIVPLTGIHFHIWSTFSYLTFQWIQLEYFSLSSSVSHIWGNLLATLIFSGIQPHDEHLFLRNAVATATCEDKDQEKTHLPPLKSTYFHIRKTKSLSLHVKVMHWLHQHVSSSVCWQSSSMMSFPEHSCLSSCWKLYACCYTSWPSFFHFFFKSFGIAGEN